jgi:hypothetical protein
MNNERFLKAPWTSEEVVLLNVRQQVSWLHEYQCTGDCTLRHESLPIIAKLALIATTDGWYCPLCQYRQNWAHRSDLDLVRHILKEARNAATADSVH